MGVASLNHNQWMSSQRLFWGAIALCWLDLFLELEPTWRFDPQYFYGYLIPLAGGFLFWRAWHGMPRRIELVGLFKLEWLLWVLIGIIWFGLSAVLEVYSYGRLFLWGKALLVVGVTLYLIWRQGGLSAVRFMAMLMVFLLLSVPWPTRVEGPLVGGLALAITTVTVDLLNVMGYTALQQGRLIEFGGAAPLGVEEACSGIRSLQLSLAFSLYFGELHRLGLVSRFGLMAGGVVFAFIGNLIRTLGLSYVVIEHGTEHFDFWHDVLGGTVIAVVLGGLWTLGNGLCQRRSELIREQASEVVVEQLRSDRLRFVGMMIVLLAGFLMVQAWFLLHEMRAEHRTQVSFNWDQLSDEVKFSQLPEVAAEMLGYQRGVQGVWTDSQNRRWIGAFVTWNDQVAALSSKLHRPDVCLRAAGHDLLDYHEDVPYRNGALEVDLRCYSFRSYAGEQFYVFYAFWMDGSDQWKLEIGSIGDYIGYASRGIRFQGAKMIQIYAPAGLTERQAKLRVVEILDAGLQVES